MMQTMTRALPWLNLSLLILYPVAWFAPLLRGAVLPWFGMTEISVISGLQSLWGTDSGLALLVTFLAVFAPYAKTILLALVQFGLLSNRTLPVLHLLGRLAMADIFLAALYIILAKGIGHATVEVAWGLWLFTACILGQMALSWVASGAASWAARQTKA
jgi:paraquat-inducible protein A